MKSNNIDYVDRSIFDIFIIVDHMKIIKYLNHRMP